MANRVQGKNIRVYMEHDAEYFEVFCGKTMSFSIDQDELETSSVNSGAFREYLPGMASATLEIGGVTISDNTGGRVSITYIHQKSIQQNLQNWKIKLTDDDGGNIIYLFSGMIKTSSFDKTIPGFSQSSVSIRVSGEIEITTIDPPPPGGVAEIIRSDWWTMAPGDTYIDGSSDVHGYSLEAVTILEVDRSGIQYDIITSGSPTQRQCKHNNTTGVINFDPALPSNGETVFVLFKYTP